MGILHEMRIVCPWQHGAFLDANSVLTSQERVLWELMGQQQEHFDGTVRKEEAASRAERSRAERESACLPSIIHFPSCEKQLRSVLQLLFNPDSELILAHEVMLWTELDQVLSALEELLGDLGHACGPKRKVLLAPGSPCLQFR